MYPSVARVPVALCGAAALLLTAAACAGSDSSADSSGAAPAQSSAGYPVSLENCDRTLTFESAPERVVTLWQAPTEMMLALGLKDRIAAMAGNYGPFPDSVAQQAEDIPEIGTSMAWPSKETLLSQDPDLVIGQSLEGFAFDTASGYASVEQIEEGGSQVYGVSMCGATDNLKMDIDTAAKGLQDLGTIFGVSDRADEIVAQMQTQKQAVIDAVQGKEDVKVAFYNGGEGPLIVLAGGIYDSAISTAGGTNVFPAESVYVSKEEFAASDADVVLVGTFEGQDYSTLSDYLKKTFPDLPAVQDDRLVEIPVADTDASVSVMKGLTEIANALHPDLNLAVPQS